MAAPRKYALDFRRDETAYVMERWLASQSCALVGIGSVGKSNLLQHLANPEVQTHYMGKQQTTLFRAIIIDPNLLGAVPTTGENDPAVRAWSAYELMMHRLFLAFYPFDMLTAEEARRLYESYQALQDGSNPLYAYMALRYFELGLEFLLRRGAQVVFMFDEFEELLRGMPVQFFRNLRGLRDAHKSQLAFLTFTRSPIKVLANAFGISAIDIEPFEELFTDHTYFVGPYNQADATRMLSDLTARTGKQLPTYLGETLLHLTGGYAGLLRSAFSLVDPAQIPATEEGVDLLAQQLLNRAPIRSECRVIWMSLTPAEQIVLRAVARLARYDMNSETEAAVAQLVQKRLLRLDRHTQQLSIHPPLFRLYVLNARDEGG